MSRASTSLPICCPAPHKPYAGSLPGCPIPWRSTHSSAAPTLDGVVEDLWSQAVPLDVTVREALGGGAAKVVTLRALHTDDSFYVLARWPDSTRSDQRDPYLWNPTSWQAPDFLDT